MRNEVSLFLAVPMYGGNCNGTFAANTQEFLIQAALRGIKIHTHYMYNESLITRARNYAADAFLRSDATHMMFIDADINYHWMDIFAMLQLQLDESAYDIICAIYPKKTIAWEKIIAAVNAGVGEKDPNHLEAFVGDFVVNFLPGTTKVNFDQPLEVLESGTGFMMIRRATFEKWKAFHPNWSYRPDHVRMKDFDGSREIHGYFMDPLEPVTEVNDKGETTTWLRHLSEDYFFCQYARKAGMQVWICPWMELKHVGTYSFGGVMKAMAQVGASFTSDAAKIAQR